MQAFFLPAGDDREGQRFCLHQAPVVVPARGSCLYVAPFAEEMNKSRRMAALQSRALAAAGFGVLQMDLHGCGDSSGDLDDASWSGWIDDVCLGARWLRERYEGPLWIWGLRAGCLLACAAAERLTEPFHLLFWQPPTSGKPLLQQFLRLRMASEMKDGRTAGVTERLREELTAGRTIEVAGYRLGPGVALGLDLAQLKPPPTRGVAVFMETSTREDARLLPATQSALQSWKAAGHTVSSHLVQGPAFWQTQEIEEAPRLIAATVAVIAGAQFEVV